MAAEASVLRLVSRTKELANHVAEVRAQLRSVQDPTSMHVPVVVTGRVLNVIMSSFEIDARAEYSISMELNPKLVQLVSTDTKVLQELRNMEIDILERIHSDLETRAAAARRELPQKGEA